MKASTRTSILLLFRLSSLVVCVVLVVLVVLHLDFVSALSVAPVVALCCS